MARTKVSTVPEVGNEAPEFSLPSAQGGQLRLSVRTARGPVVVVFYQGLEPDEDVDYFKALAEKEDEINMAAASVVGIGVSGPEEARELVAKTGIKSYMLYDYARVASRDWGLLVKDKKLGEYARPAVFIVGADREVIHAWLDERPEPAEILARISEVTGLPKPPEEEGEEKPKKPAKAKAEAKSEGDTDSPTASETEEKPSSEKPSPEEREKRRAERKAARESGETSEADGSKAENPETEKPESGKETKSVNSEPSPEESAETEEEKAK